MKKPPHPGGFVLRQCIEPLGLTITQAAEALGVTRTTLSELVNGRRGISPERAVRLSKVFGGSAETWLTQQAHYDLARVRADRIRVQRLRFAHGEFAVGRGTQEDFFSSSHLAESCASQCFKIISVLRKIFWHAPYLFGCN